MDIIKKYFPSLTNLQYESFNKLLECYVYWNDKVNLVSRKDVDNLNTHHILHSLSIGAFYNFKANSSILDVGTGGGFPGLPLAILFPECKFYLIDSIGKKINVVNNIAQSLSLKNVTAKQIRAEQVKEKFDFIVSRAVTRLPLFLNWTPKNLKKGNDKGILYLKGGDISDELSAIKLPYTLHNISEKFKEPFFDTKLLVHIYSK